MRVFEGWNGGTWEGWEAIDFVPLAKRPSDWILQQAGFTGTINDRWRAFLTSLPL